MWNILANYIHFTLQPSNLTHKEKISKIKASQNNIVPWYFLFYHSIIDPISFFLKNASCHSLNWFHYPIKGRDPLFQNHCSIWMHTFFQGQFCICLKNRNDFFSWTLEDILLYIRENHNYNSYYQQNMLNISMLLEGCWSKDWKAKVNSDSELCVWNTFSKIIFAASKWR